MAQEKGDLPRFAFPATVKSGSQSKTSGATWTGEKGYATLDGVTYGIPRCSSSSSARASTQASPLAAIDASKWITDPRNEGFADVGGVETVKVTGGADIAAALADVEKLSASLGSLGSMLGGKSLSITPADRQRAADAVKDAKVEVYTGADDSKLRRLVVSATIDGKPVVLDLTLTKVGEDVAIPEPKGAKPFSELMQKSGRGGPDKSCQIQ